MHAAWENTHGLQQTRLVHLNTKYTLLFVLAWHLSPAFSSAAFSAPPDYLIVKELMGLLATLIVGPVLSSGWHWGMQRRPKTSGAIGKMLLSIDIKGDDFGWPWTAISSNFIRNLRFRTWTSKAFAPNPCVSWALLYCITLYLCLWQIKLLIRRYLTNFCIILHQIAYQFLPRNALQCRARSCDRMLSVRLSVCLSVCDVGGLWSHRLEILETNCTDY